MYEIFAVLTLFVLIVVVFTFQIGKRAVGKFILKEIKDVFGLSKYEATIEEGFHPQVSVNEALKEVSREKKEEKVFRKEAPPKKEKMVVVSDILIHYPEEVYVGKEDYIMRVTFLPKNKKLEVVEESLKEKKERIEFLAEEEEPIVEVALSSTAFIFDNPTKVVKLSKSKPSTVSFIISPKEGMAGRRKLNVSIRYKNLPVKDVFITINVKEYLVDSVTFVQVNELKKVSTLLSVVCGIISIVSFMLGL